MSECTCGNPNYPVIDLTPAMILYRQSSGNGLDYEYNHHAECYDYNLARETLCEQVYMACRDYGFFHVQLRNECPTCLKPLYLSGLFRKYNQVIENIRTLFQESFLQSMVDESIHSLTYNIPIYRPLSGNSYTVSYATFRGQGTESGSVHAKNNLDSNLKTEPKQSWELHRCSSVLGSPVDVTNYHSRLESMHNYIQVLHSIAACIVSPFILNLPRSTFLSEDPCSCGLNKGPDVITDSDRPYCCIDLLRIFLYDAAASLEDQEKNLGSNPHTDWGSLTIVWQDFKGGLQNYCYDHHRWNDVMVPIDEKHEEDNNTYFFVHIGDFLSLAMNHQVSRQEHVEKKGRRVIWPSPRHQVLCPVQLVSDIISSSDDTKSKRCSLVYFLYPPIGVSLQDAEERLNKSEYIKQGCLNNEEGQHSILKSHSDKTLYPYDRHILLLDQSSSKDFTEEQSLSPCDVANATYQRLRSRPFHQVIQEKWSQVQRSSSKSNFR